MPELTHVDLVCEDPKCGNSDHWKPARIEFACCSHCEHTDAWDDLHDTPCDHGCNDHVLAEADDA